MANLLINGVSVKAPKSFQLDVMDIDGKSERNAAATLTRDRIAVKRKIQLEWGHLSDIEISKILTAVSQVFFTVTYPDAMTGGQETKTFYVGDRSAPAYTWHPDLAAYKWEGLTMNFIER